MTDKVIELLKESDALLEGHFLLSSGRHSNRYVQCAKLTEFPKKAEIVSKIMKDKLKGLEVEKVCGPAMGGIIIAYELARALDVPAIFTEREDGEMTLRRGFEVEKGEKVLIVEDVVTTGKSSLETIRALEKLGAEVVGVSCIVDRSGKEELPFELYPATQLEVETYDHDNCPLCEKQLPLIKPGSRKIFS